MFESDDSTVHSALYYLWFDLHSSLLLFLPFQFIIFIINIEIFTSILRILWQNNLITKFFRPFPLCSSSYMTTSPTIALELFEPFNVRVTHAPFKHMLFPLSLDNSLSYLPATFYYSLTLSYGSQNPLKIFVSGSFNKFSSVIL